MKNLVFGLLYLSLLSLHASTQPLNLLPYEISLSVNSGTAQGNANFIFFNGVGRFSDQPFEFGNERIGIAAPNRSWKLITALK